MPSVVDKEKGAVRTIPSNKGIIVQAWRTASVCNLFWHSESLSQRNDPLFEAVRMQTRRTPYQWLVACDASMEPEALTQGMLQWQIDDHQNAARTFYLPSQVEALVAIMNDYVVLCRGLDNRVVDPEHSFIPLLVSRMVFNRPSSGTAHRFSCKSKNICLYDTQRLSTVSRTILPFSAQSMDSGDARD